MKLKDAKTRGFMPDFAFPAAWLCDGLDNMLTHCDGRLNCLPAPLTLEACEALTDEEMQAFYEEQGLAAYYPDISHERRAWLLYMQNFLWRFLGTPQAMETLCTYLFDQIGIKLDVQDNLAFTEDGQLIDSDLLDVFDAELNIYTAYLPENTLWRVLSNIRKFTRNSQWMRAFTFTFNLDHVPVSVTPTDGGIYAVDYECDFGTIDPRLFTIRHNLTTNNGEAQSFAVDFSVERAQ